MAQSDPANELLCGGGSVRDPFADKYRELFVVSAGTSVSHALRLASDLMDAARVIDDDFVRQLIAAIAKGLVDAALNAVVAHEKSAASGAAAEADHE